MEKGKERKSGQPADEGTIGGMYENWFLDYASYVILERAVPKIEDGLKPVQRRILHALKQMDDGRFHKVANVIGQTMQYHPHGDASIADAMVNIGQKDLLIDCQGNWGDTRTGDPAAASRYIETKLSKFALDVAFNKDTTDWKLTYDGRKKEPLWLPVKFPLLLYQGVEGIAVGLATKIMPHNFIELVKGSISVLKGKVPKLFPDFPDGGFADCSQYNDGLKGGKIKLRVGIEKRDKKTLVIKDVPFGVTTGTLIDSVIKANDRGKIKIAKIIDNTAKDVEIVIDLPSGISPDVTRDALYAFTDCEVSISPNACVIIDDRPHFIGVREMLRMSTDNTVALLKLELEIRLNNLQEKLHMASLEKIFIEKRIYRDIEECTTWESVLSTIEKGLKKYVATPLDKAKKSDKRLKLLREITEEDLVRLTEIKIKRISKYDSFKADEQMVKLQEDIKETKTNLKNLTEYAIDYFENLLKKYGKGKERKTQITNFEDIEVKQVAVANQKLYVDRKNGFIGYGLKKEEFVCECSDIDDIIVLRKDGRMIVSRLSDKTFVGKNVLHVGVWRKGDERTVYNMIYVDPKSNRNYAKRFSVKSITRDKVYDLTSGDPKSKVHYLSYNPNGEAEKVTVSLSPDCRAKIKQFDFDFSDLAIKGRMSKGNILSRWPIRKITVLESGKSTLGGIDIYADLASGKLNTKGNGVALGSFNSGDFVVAFFKDGSYTMTDFERTNYYPPEELVHIERFDNQSIVSCVYYNGEKKAHFVKRFEIATTVLDQRFKFISEVKGSKLEVMSTLKDPILEYKITKGTGKKKSVEQDQLWINKFIEVKGWKSLGNRLNKNKTSHFKIVEEIKI